ncbi:MAG: hypothetical protein ABJ056_02805 [Halioglobus sp.]
MGMWTCDVGYVARTASEAALVQKSLVTACKGIALELVLKVQSLSKAWAYTFG